MTDPALLAEYERRFRDNPDPWAFATNPYEQAKRTATLSACGGRRRDRILELGAANGILARALAPRGRELVAVEGVASAAEVAETTLRPWPCARVVHGLIPAAVPPGPYDLIVASEILYYLDELAYTATLAALPSWLAPGGRLVAVHWRPETGERPRGAAAVHRDLHALPGLVHVSEAPTADYRLDAWDRVR